MMPPPVPISSARLHRLHFRLQKRMPMWVVYRPTTREYPGRWVTRMFVTLPKLRTSRFVMTHYTLDALRDMLPPGLVMLGRRTDDVPEIEEIWM